MRHVLGCLVLSLSITACGAAAPVPLDLRDRAADEPELELVWVGRGECERMEGDAFVRAPAFDYDFSVVQRRYADRWESVKTMRRLHSGYDGSAGPREQVLGFRIGLDAMLDGRAGGEVRSTLGIGRWTADPEFRESTVTLAADVSAMAPFDTYRIVQHYRYEDGELEEEVELRDGGEAGPIWVRNHEHARLFAVRTFDGAPTRAR